MEAEFWHDRWENNEIGFHLDEANPSLIKYFGALSLPQGARVFVPLCGKTLDIPWLLSQGYRVAGAELSELAIQQLFAEMSATPEVTDLGSLKKYSAPGIDIFVGDIFDVTVDLLGPIDGIYDRAALVALPPEMRKRYTAHLRAVTDTAPQLLLTFEYDQSVMPGPPFSIVADEVQVHYADHYSIELLSSKDLPGGLKGKADASEHVWVLK